MSNCRVTLSCGAGVCLELGGKRLWADALHNERLPGFSTLDDTLAQALLAHPAFQSPDLIFYTHCHPDHFSRSLTERAAALWPYAELILPEPVFPEQLLLSRPRERIVLPELTLRFARLPHEGPQYAGVPHYGCVAEHDGFRVLLTGDCAVAAPELAAFVAETGPVDLAVVDFPWITLRKGRDFIREVLRPRHLLVDHLPFQEDDCYGYRAAARRAMELVEVPDIRLLEGPFQQETM